MSLTLLTRKIQKTLFLQNIENCWPKKKVPKGIFDVKTDEGSFDKGRYFSTGCVFFLFVKQGYISALPEQMVYANTV